MGEERSRIIEIEPAQSRSRPRSRAGEYVLNAVAVAAGLAVLATMVVGYRDQSRAPEPCPGLGEAFAAMQGDALRQLRVAAADQPRFEANKVHGSRDKRGECRYYMTGHVLEARGDTVERVPYDGSAAWNEHDGWRPWSSISMPD